MCTINYVNNMSMLLALTGIAERVRAEGVESLSIDGGKAVIAQIRQLNDESLLADDVADIRNAKSSLLVIIARAQRCLEAIVMSLSFDSSGHCSMYLILFLLGF